MDPAPQQPALEPYEPKHWHLPVFIGVFVVAVILGGVILVVLKNSSSQSNLAAESSMSGAYKYSLQNTSWDPTSAQLVSSASTNYFAYSQESDSKNINFCMETNFYNGSTCSLKGVAVRDKGSATLGHYTFNDGSGCKVDIEITKNGVRLLDVSSESTSTDVYAALDQMCNTKYCGTHGSIDQTTFPSSSLVPQPTQADLQCEDTMQQEKTIPWVSLSRSPIFFQSNGRVYNRNDNVGGGGVEEVVGADPMTFVVPDASSTTSAAAYSYAKDKNHVYFRTPIDGSVSVIVAADPATFVVLDLPGRFAQDKNHKYVGHDVLCEDPTKQSCSFDDGPGSGAGYWLQNIQ